MKNPTEVSGPSISGPKDAVPKGGGLLQSFGITLGGVLGADRTRDDRATAAAFLEPGSLHVHLVSALGLKAADRNGKSDPYAKLELAGQRATSKTMMATLDPQWDEHFEFVGVRGELLKQSLHISVFDWDRLTTDDKLGVADLQLDTLLYEQELREDVELSEQGRVCLRLRWVPRCEQPCDKEAGASRTTKDLEAAPPAAGVSRPQQLQEAVGKVCVHLLRGEGLEAPNKSNGKLDPFVKLSLGGQTLTSKTTMKTLDPRWNQVLEFKGVQRSVLASKPLKLSVYDWDLFSGVRSARHASLSRNDSLCSASVDLSPLLVPGSFLTSNKYYTVELTKHGLSAEARHALGEDPDPSLGRLFLSAKWVSDDETALSRWITGVGGRLLSAAARCITYDGFAGSELDCVAIPAKHQGTVWAARQYYMLTYAGPREGECSDRPVSLIWLHQMVEAGHLPRDLKVWRVEGGKAWMTLGREIDQVVKAEQKAVKQLGKNHPS